MQATAGKQPTTGTANQNSLNVLSFDGGDYLQKSSSNVKNIDQTWFVVAQVDTVDNSSDSLLAYGGWADGKWQFNSDHGTAFYGKMRKNASTGITGVSRASSSTNLIGSYRLYSLSFNRTNSTFSAWMDGTNNNDSKADATAIAVNSKITVMGSRQSTPNSPIGKMAEIIYLKSVADTDRIKVEGYLAHKWGVTSNLPSTHLYKSTAPSANVPLTAVSLGSKPLGSFSHNLTGLTPGTRYHYRFLGTNSGGRGFSPTKDFVTIGSPTVEASGASWVTSKFSYLKCQDYLDWGANFLTPSGIKRIVLAARPWNLVRRLSTWLIRQLGPHSVARFIWSQQGDDWCRWRSGFTANEPTANFQPVVTFDGDDATYTTYDFNLNNANHWLNDGFTAFGVARYTGGDNEAVITSDNGWIFGHDAGNIGATILEDGLVR